MSTFYEEMPLSEARSLLRQLAEEGHECPCCRQYAKVYRRRIHAAMAAGLVKLYRAQAGTAEGAADGHYVQIAEAGLTHRMLADFAKLRYWGLAEEEAGVREDGSGRTGWWQITDRGVAWVRDATTVPRYARIYDGRALSLTGPAVDIREALGKRFDYDELMAGV